MEIKKSCMAYVGKVLEVFPIPDADRIMRATVVCGKGGRWTGVVRKGDVQEGDSVVVFLPDAVVPKDNPALAFMEKQNYRVKMMRLRGCPSEVLIMPVPDLFPIQVREGLGLYVGMDVTDVLGVMKYEKEIPLSMAGEMAGSFPSFIRKTDEPNYQTVPYLVEALWGWPYFVSEKADGSSATVYWRDGHFGCCSRNWELRETKGSAIWSIAREYELEKFLSEQNMAIQFEVVGPGIHGNPMGLTRVEPRLFNVIPDLSEYGLVGGLEAVRQFSEACHFPMVKVVEVGFSFDYTTDEQFRTIAEGKYDNGKQREGIVIRAQIPRYVGRELVSFKVINLLYRD